MRSEIRLSVMNRLAEKARKQNYGKYLVKVNLEKLRAFDSQTINFDFPVTALIGPNGGGKTTVLGACALIYRQMQPRTFFTKNQQFDKEMQNWSISYELVDKNINSRDTIKKKAAFTKAKWSRDALERAVLFQGVSRTLPAVERRDLTRFTIKQKVYPAENINKLEKAAAEAITRILDKDVSNYSIIHHLPNGELTLFAGQTKDGRSFSEFHFGAGESSVIKIVNSIEQASENSLILIEEIENGLHPVAVTKLVEYLIDVADRKSAQIVYTTHSVYATALLPDDAVWAALDGRLQQGKLDIMSLRTLVGESDAELVIFVEDEFAKSWVLSMLRYIGNIALSAIEIYAMGGDGTAVNVHKNRKKDPSIKTPSICIIDGDSRQIENEADMIFRLPGEAPEPYIIDTIIERMSDVCAKLAVRLSYSSEKQRFVSDIVESVYRANMDHHLLFIQIGDKLGYLSEDNVRTAFLSTWCEIYGDKVTAFTDQIVRYLPKEK